MRRLLLWGLFCVEGYRYYSEPVIDTLSLILLCISVPLILFGAIYPSILAPSATPITLRFIGTLAVTSITRISARSMWRSCRTSIVRPFLFVHIFLYMTSVQNGLEIENLTVRQLINSNQFNTVTKEILPQIWIFCWISSNHLVFLEKINGYGL